MFCYYHREFKNQEIETFDNPFCSEEEHSLWADKHYGPKGNPNKKKSIEEIMARLKEMGGETPTLFNLDKG